MSQCFLCSVLSLHLGRDGEEQQKSTLCEHCGETSEYGPMAVETRFLIERVVHREHGS